MPGTKWKRSLKNPRAYKALRRKGMSKTRAAKISNSKGKKGKKATKKTRKKRR
jgi:hypothetical protein